MSENTAAPDDEEEEQSADTIGLLKLNDIVSSLIRPVKQEPLREWADKNRIMPAGAARPGQWSTNWCVPAPAIYDAWSNPLVSEVIIICGTQMLKSEFLINVIFQLVEQDPCPILLLQPDVSLAKIFAKKRIGASAKLMEYHQPWLAPENAQGQKGSGTMLDRPFPGGFIEIKSTEQTTALLSTSYKVILCDEVNKFQRDVRGDINSRQSVFHDSRVVMVSSAGEKGSCRITSEWERGDKQKWNLKCPHCETYFYPKWEYVQWTDNDPTTGCYVCQDCGVPLDNSDMHKANVDGKWIAGAEFNGVASFMVNAFAHQTVSLHQLITEFIDATQHYDRYGEDHRLKSFFCDRMSETYLNQAGVVDPSKVENKLRIDYPIGKDTMPPEVVLITAAVDVQKDRLEVDVCGWGSYQAYNDKTEEFFTRPVRFKLAYFKIKGSPGAGAVYKELLEYYKTAQFTRPDGLRLKIAIMGIDTGGAPSDTIERFIRKTARAGHEIYPLKGTNKKPDPLWRKSLSTEQEQKWIKDLILVGAHAAKDNHFSSLRRSLVAPIEASEWYFPRNPDRGYNKEYFAGLVSEQEVSKVDKQGRTTKIYMVIGKSRNEPLDLSNYNEAIMRYIGIESLPAKAEKYRKAAERRNRK